MRLQVISDQPALAGHKLYLPEEVFEVTDPVGEMLLERFPNRFAALDAEPEPAPEPEPQQPTPVEDLDLSSRVLDALDANGIETVDELRLLVNRGDAAMLDIPGIGPRALEELKAALE
jgi:DNA-directed RNA polymerase alpha subunit